MLYGHFVVSGHQEESAICCLCGFVAEADDRDRFDPAWREVLADFSTGFQVSDCFYGIGAFQSWNLSRRYALLASLSEVLARSEAVPMGALVVREDFRSLSSADRAILAAEGIEDPLDLIFYDWTERIIHWTHEQSEKISLLFARKSQSRTEQYRALFNKHVSRYLLGFHLTGALAFADIRDSCSLQAATLLGETVLVASMQREFPFTIPPALQQMTERINQGRFETAELKKLTAKLESLRRKSPQL